MRKRIKAVVIICGIAGAGILGYSSFKNVLEQAKVVQVSYYHSPLYITAAAENLRDGFKTYSLYHLEAALGKKEEVKDVVKLEEITKAAERIVDKYAKNENYREGLLDLANTLYEEQKMEIARNKLKSDFEKKFIYNRSFSYHLWLVYNVSLKKSHSVEDTHKELRDYYKKGDPFEYLMVDSLLSDVEKELPKGDSELVKKIKSYDRK